MMAVNGASYVSASLKSRPRWSGMPSVAKAPGAKIEKTAWGKLAATFWYPGKSAVRYALKADFIDAFGAQEFFAYRKRGVEPSGIPSAVTQEAIAWTLAQPDESVFAITPRPDFAYQPPKGSFKKSRCSKCGEYVFERYVRWLDGKPVCIPCSGYGR